MTCIDAHEITPGLWQGSIPPTGSELERAGFTVLVLCAQDYQFQGEDYLFPGVRIVRAPNVDDYYEELTREVAITAAKEVVQEVVREGKALVTCVAGLNRSGLVSALTLHLLYGWPGKKCIQQVRRKRMTVILHPQHYPLSNPKFVEALEALPERPPMIPEPR